jgi:hypothetical protein
MDIYKELCQPAPLGMVFSLDDGVEVPLVVVVPAWPGPGQERVVRPGQHKYSEAQIQPSTNTA